MKVRFLTSIATHSASYAYNEVANIPDSEAVSLCFTGSAEPVDKDGKAKLEAYAEERNKEQEAALEVDEPIGEDEELMKREEELEAKEQKLAELNKTIEEQNVKLDERSAALDAREQQLNELQNGLEKQKVELDARELVLNNKPK